MSVIRQAPRETRSPPGAPADQRLVLHNVTWQTYEKLLDALGDRPVRLTYDRGRLELMAPSWNHEWWKRRFGLLIVILALELGIRIQGGGSTTYRREDLERGLEPDECFYIEHVADVLGLREIDLSRDPPPDLAIEIDMTASSVDREGIYAALRVPELWRFDGESLRAYRLGSGGTYEVCERSRAFPLLPLQEFLAFMNETQGLDDASLIQSFRNWVRQRVLSGGQETADGSPPSP